MEYQINVFPPEESKAIHEKNAAESAKLAQEMEERKQRNVQKYIDWINDEIRRAFAKGRAIEFLLPRREDPSWWNTAVLGPCVNRWVIEALELLMDAYQKKGYSVTPWWYSKTYWKMVSFTFYPM